MYPVGIVCRFAKLSLAGEAVIQTRMSPDAAPWPYTCQTKQAHGHDHDHDFGRKSNFGYHSQKSSDLKPILKYPVDSEGTPKCDSFSQFLSQVRHEYRDTTSYIATVSLAFFVSVTGTRRVNFAFMPVLIMPSYLNGEHLANCRCQGNTACKGLHFSELETIVIDGDLAA